MRYDERKEAEAFERGLNIGRLEAAKDLAAAEERGRRRGVEEAAKVCEGEDVVVVRDTQVYVGQTLKNIANAIRALAPPLGLEQAMPRDPFGILAPRDSAPLSAKDRAHLEDVADRYERGEFHCSCGKPLTAEHPRCK